MHLFRREIGVSPAKYLDDLMLREAEHLIKTTTLSVRDIFRIVGATDPSHFLRKLLDAPSHLLRTARPRPAGISIR